MNTTLKRSLTLLALAAGAALGGCAGKAAVATLYDFGPPPAPPAAAAPPPALATLVVADATGPAWLDSQRMHYRLLYADAQQSRPYANNRWNSTPLQLLSQRLKSRIAQSGVKVLATTDAAAGVALLRVEVDDFSHNFDSQTQSSGRLNLRASLFRGHRLVDQKTFSRASGAASADAAGGARALAAASDAVAADLLAWLAALPPQKE
ncbi:ABC-type transport auxiliary lipoprotein family protein [Janthinobacterium fluminis]|uniref:ABC-type transport auxiliary lipoprotein family protein n=1 Tax=Janthinobacterium fluminis TaxID=2987524 RepID=A0ABT5K124_9BURK|nr:ABC-type transport auxiliary lipoprotein family protein [Janthinobacterium fluminis]MDC8758155.1 ABC-type transport auxiliary lipoprotein family protein [Janthinobacterium fluminis]